MVWKGVERCNKGVEYEVVWWWIRCVCVYVLMDNRKNRVFTHAELT